MLTKQQIYDYRDIYPTFDAERMIKWLESRNKKDPKTGAYKGFSSVQRANKARRFDEGCARIARKD